MDHLSEAISYVKFNLVMESSKTFTRDEAREIDAEHMGKGSKIEVIDFRRIDTDCIDYINLLLPCKGMLLLPLKGMHEHLVL